MEPQLFLVAGMNLFIWKSAAGHIYVAQGGLDVVNGNLPNSKIFSLLNKRRGRRVSKSNYFKGLFLDLHPDIYTIGYFF